MTCEYTLKCITVGDSGVGKSSLILQFTDNRFFNPYPATIGIELGVKTISLRSKRIKLNIWDTAGQENFRSLVKSYYRDTCIVFLVYDITNKFSFISLNVWYRDLADLTNNPHIILIGNKCDLVTDRQVSFEEGKQFATDNNMLFIETSAKLSQNVNDAFIMIVDKTLQDIESGSINIFSENSGIRVNSNISKPNQDNIGDDTDSDSNEFERKIEKTCCST